MPMVRIRLACGCWFIRAYEQRVLWKELPEKERQRVVRELAAAHVCKREKPEKPPSAPVMSGQPQKP